MRNCRSLFVLAACLLLFGCKAADSPEATIEDVSPEGVIKIAAFDAFGVGDSAVTAEYRIDPEDGRSNWNVVIVLENVDSTASVDVSAARVLATVASVDTSDSPISVSVVASELALAHSDYEWGSLTYRWAGSDNPPFLRGSDVTLTHAESDPPEIGTGGIPMSVVRGHWQDVDIPTLEEWSREGTPDPMLLPGDNQPFN